VGELKASFSKWLKTQSDELCNYAWQAVFAAISVSSLVFGKT
jgi:hypothetical protein